MIEEYQIRVAKERRELEEKRTSLRSFMCSPAFLALDSAERGRLHLQVGVMTLYSEILRMRMDAWVAAEKKAWAAEQEEKKEAAP